MARDIDAGDVDALEFEIDALGRVLPGTIEAKSGAAACATADCARVRNVLAGALAMQAWTPATRDGRAVGARVIVPLRRDVERLGSTPNTP